MPGMWVFRPAVGDDPKLASMNSHQGRQTWAWDPSAGTPEQLAAVEAARAKFAANRLSQRHSADELLRLQAADRVAAAASAGDVPPQPPPPAGDAPLPAEAVAASLRGGVGFYEALQCDDGHFPGDYGGPMFLMPGLLITLYTCGVLDEVLPAETHQREMRRYLLNHQNADGGFGLHIEGGSTMFGTALSYVSLRLLGVGPEEKECVAARAWMHERGGATYITSWGKFWLAVLGVYSWDGMNPLNPEMWLLPYARRTGVGFLHPGRFWCHCRMVYLPMSYVYGVQGTCRQTALTLALQQELYPRAYASIDWNAARSTIAAEDLYYPHPMVQDALWWSLYQAEGLLRKGRPLWPLRRRSLKEVVKHVRYEDRNTRFLAIGPVNKVINALVMWLEEGPDSEAFKRHIPRFSDYLWVAEDGMKMQGYNGSQLWDTSFAAQAVADAGSGVWGKDAAAGGGGGGGSGAAARRLLSGCLRYVDATQVDAESEPPLEEYYRHISKGAWPFSTRDHGWPISDCTSEGFKAAAACAQLPPLARENRAPLSDARMAEAVDVILSYQNRDGGMATYEKTRSFHALEIINPAETFGDIIVDYSYVECTSACITALLAYVRRRRNAQAAPEGDAARLRRLAAALRRAEAFVRRVQRPDGSWYGSWGVCFTYGTWFGCAALSALGHTVPSGDAAQKKACAFLLARQQEDGGWGESYLSCQDKEYAQLEGGSHVVNTAWAMIALIAAGWHEAAADEDAKAGGGGGGGGGGALAPLHRAARFLMRAQEPSGDWPQQHISGVFNRNCMITYANYRNIFPIWALGLYRRCVLGGARRVAAAAAAVAAADGRGPEEGGGGVWCAAISDYLVA